MDKTIDVNVTMKDLINAGYTPERLYSYALAELNRQNKIKAEEEAKKKAEEAKRKAEEEKKAKEAELRERKLKGYRNRCIGAFRDYMEYLTGEKIDKSILATYCDTLDKIEAITANPPKTYDNLDDYLKWFRDMGY